MNKKTFLFLIAIIFLGAVLRFWQLGKVPPSPDWDEAALGYNAYSILTTGRDEYGTFLPVVLRSFDDYKPALYSYLSMPFIKVFGLNIVSVRLPSATLGVLTIIAVFFLVKEIFRKNSIALLSSFLLAISPWHIQFSRIAFESNVGLSLNIFWIFIFLKSFKKYWLLVPASFIAGINLYTYQSEKVFTPLLIIVFLGIFRRQLLAIPKKYLAFAFFVGIIVVLPMLTYILTNGNALARAKGVSVFSDSTTNLSEQSRKLLVDKKNNDLLGLVLDNRRIEYAKSIIFGYISHFDFNWLFITGDQARHHAPHVGLLYLWELPFLLIGIYSFLFGNIEKKYKLLIFSWFLIAPIPASVTGGVPHAVRTLNFLPTFQIFTAYGIITTLFYLNNKKNIYQKILILIFGIFSLFNFAYYLNQYFVQQNYFNSGDWQYGYEKAVLFIEKNQDKYSKIVVSNQDPMDQSYMFFLFYLKYSPALYQEETKSSSGGFRENHKFGKYEFRPIKWDVENKAKSVLYAGRGEDFPSGVKKIFEVRYLNGSSAISVVGM